MAEKEPYPLWLPKGSVRALIALTVIIAVILMVFAGVVVPEWLYALAAAVVGWYFGTRTAATPT